MELKEVLYFLGAGLCHQNPARSFSVDNVTMPVCSRCAGIYIALAVSVALIVGMERRAKTGLPPKKYLIPMAVVLLIMGADVAISTLQIFESSHLQRFITGFMFGWCLPLVLIPLRNILVFPNQDKSYYLKSKSRLLSWIGSALVVMVAFYLTYDSGFWWWSVLSVAGLITFSSLILLILFFALCPTCTGKVNQGWLRALVYFSAVISSMVLLSGFSAIRFYWFQ